MTNVVQMWCQDSSGDKPGTNDNESVSVCECGCDQSHCESLQAQVPGLVNIM